MKKSVLFFLAGFVVCALAGALTFKIWGTQKMSKVHTLEFPLLLGADEQSKNLHLLPKGTTIYFDQSYPEGFTRYKSLANTTDRMKFVGDIATQFNKLMLKKKPYIEGELRKIRGWLDA